jgi:hypothetical protein
LLGLRVFGFALATGLATGFPAALPPAFSDTSFTFLLNGVAHSSNDIVTFGPGSVQDFREQPTLTGGD